MGMLETYVWTTKLLLWNNTTVGTLFFNALMIAANTTDFPPPIIAKITMIDIDIEYIDIDKDIITIPITIAIVIVVIESY